MKPIRLIIVLAVVLIFAFAVLAAMNAGKHSERPGSSVPASAAPSSSVATATDPCSATGTIVTVPGTGKTPIYALCFQLNSTTVQFNDPQWLSPFEEDDGQSEGGEFEVLLSPSTFPVASPGSCKSIILRMPWTLYSESPDAKNYIAAKKTLYEEISSLKSSQNVHVNTVISLNPYVTATQKTPLRLRLTECNVFFRDVNGQYSAGLN